MKLNANQLAVLTAIKNAKKATRAQATANGGNHITLKKLREDGLIVENPVTKKSTEVTYSLTAEGKLALKPAKAVKPAKLAAAGSL